MKCKIQKAIALGIALVMCATMLPTAVFAATNETVSIGSRQAFLDFVEEFNAGQHTGCNVVLTADIDLTDPATGEATEIAPIGDWDNPFTGTFDGGNNTISNATINGSDESGIIRAGLIGCVDGGAVQNLILDNITVINESTSTNTSGSIFTGSELECATGAAVATLRKGTISNVTTTGTCKVTGYLRTGGIVGDMRNVSRNDSQVTDCVNNASVTGNNLYTGGIVGAAHDCPTRANYMAGKITGCTNNGTILAANNGSNVGGIVGYADRTEISNCVNTGKVEGKGNYGTGGIVGTSAYNFNKLQTALTNPAATTISNCSNAEGAEVIGGRAGGILGAFVATPGVDVSRKATCKITDCANEGAINGSNGKCGAIYGLSITYKSGDAESYIANLVVSATGCTIGGTVYGDPATQAGPVSK